MRKKRNCVAFADGERGAGHPRSPSVRSRGAARVGSDVACASSQAALGGAPRPAPRARWRSVFRHPASACAGLKQSVTLSTDGRPSDPHYECAVHHELGVLGFATPDDQLLDLQLSFHAPRPVTSRPRPPCYLSAFSSFFPL